MVAGTARNVAAKPELAVPCLEQDNASRFKPGLLLCRSAKHADAADPNEPVTLELYSKSKGAGRLSRRGMDSSETERKITGA